MMMGIDCHACRLDGRGNAIRIYSRSRGGVSCGGLSERSAARVGACDSACRQNMSFRLPLRFLPAKRALKMGSSCTEKKKKVAQLFKVSHACWSFQSTQAKPPWLTGTAW